jgi:hypothetical protein
MCAAAHYSITRYTHSPRANRHLNEYNKYTPTSCFMHQLFLKSGRKAIRRKTKNGTPIIKKKRLALRQFGQLKGHQTKNDRAQIKKCKFVRGVKKIT